MSRIPTVSSVKHATGDPTVTADLLGLGYDVYAGDDALVLGYLAHGACGLVSVAGHVAAARIATMIDQFLGGDHDAALTSYRALSPVFRAVMGVPNYGATTAKAGLQLLGILDNRNVRGPLAELDDDELAALEAVLRAADLL